MASPSSNTALTVPPASVTRLVPCVFSTMPPLALDLEGEASSSSGDEPCLTDDILRQVFDKTGTNGEINLQGVLATCPYNVNVSGEVVCRHVNHMDNVKSSEYIDLDNSTTSEKTAGSVAAQDNCEESHEKEKAEERDRAAVVRDLDMLADTVRSIVMDVVSSEVSPVEWSACCETVEEDEGSDSNIALAEIPKMNVGMKAHTAVVMYDIDTTSTSSNKRPQTIESLDVLSDNEKADQDTGEARAPSLSNESHRGSNGSTVQVNLPKQPVMDTTALNRVVRRQKRSEYSVKTRALCVHRHQREGASYSAISKELGIPRDSVRAIIRKAIRTGSVASAPRSGRPRKTSGIVDKVILEAVRSNKQCSAKTIQEELLRVYGVKLSPETVRRRVLEHTRQRISGRTSSEALSPSSSMERNAAHTSTVPSEEATAAILSSKPLVPDVFQTDPVSLQQMLYEEGQSVSADEQEHSLLNVVTSTSNATQSPLLVDRLPAPFPTDEDATLTIATTSVDPRGVQYATHTPRDDELLSQKQHKRGEYSIETREQCVALHAQGQGYRRIGKALNMPHTTVRAIVMKARRTGSVLPAKRSGRPRKTDAIMDKVILQAAKSNEKNSARIINEKLLAAYGVRVSCETIRRRVNDHRRQCVLEAGAISISSEQDSLTSSDEELAGLHSLS